MHFFGVWSDPQKALERWLDEKDDLLAGRVPRCRAGVADAPQPAAAPPPIEPLWNDLAGADAERAYQAQWILHNHPNPDISSCWLTGWEVGWGERENLWRRRMRRLPPFPQCGPLNGD
jgi:hypothetical protein